MDYSYQKETDLDQLTEEIRNSDIVTALDHVDFDGTYTIVYFKASLSSNDKTILDTVVSDHVIQPDEPKLPTPVEVKDQPPFAKPDFRTKRNGAVTWIDVLADEVKNSDFHILSELYVSGGECIVIDSKKGDWISAEVVDKDGVIPLAYRDELAEDYPTVAEYVVRANLPPKQGSSIYTLDTYPLNAKISSGLYLRIKYHASSESGTRSFISNYYLTQKLPES